MIFIIYIYNCIFESFLRLNHIEDTRIVRKKIYFFSPFFLLVYRTSHSSLFCPLEIRARARDSSATFFLSLIATAFRSRRSSPHRQIKLESLTRHAGNRHIYLYLRPIRLGNSGIFLKFLWPSLVPSR